MQCHAIVPALDSMSQARLATLSQEVRLYCYPRQGTSLPSQAHDKAVGSHCDGALQSLAIVVIAFGELESLGCQLQALPRLCDELCHRQRSGPQLSQSLAYSVGTRHWHLH